MKICYTLLFSFLLKSIVVGQYQNERLYESTFRQIKDYLVYEKPNSFKNSVFLVENAYLEDQLDPYLIEKKIENLTSIIQKRVNSIELDYSLGDKKKIKKFASLFSILKDTATILYQGNTLYHLPYTYDFNDMFGDENWSNMFVSKLLSTKKGNCHSLPYLYKILANEIGVGEETYLALSPNHIFIKHFSQKVGWYNTELTSGFFPQDAWLKASGYIPLIAIQNGLFLVALTEQESVALCLFDLAMGYDKKFSNNDGSFIIKCCDTALKYFPACIKAMLLKAETYTRLLKKETNKESKNAKELWQKMDTLYGEVHKLGYRQMPKDMYVQWLTTVEKAKYENNAVPKIRHRDKW